MKRIKFVTGETVTHNVVYVNGSFFMLKTYHDNFGSSKYEWLEPKLSIDITVDELVQEVLDEKVDLFCAGIYCWNKIFLTEAARKLKQSNPNITIIFGGPDVTAMSEPDWFDSHPFVDYVIYGDGEKAFSNLLDHLDGQKNIQDIPNLIWHDGKRIINRHEIMRDKAYWSISPWQHCESYLRDVCQTILKDDLQPIVMWERTRGCPYSCSF